MKEIYLQCKKCESIGKGSVIYKMFEGKCMSCDSTEFKRISGQEYDRLMRDVVVRRRLTNKEWDTKWCDVCGAPAEIRLMDAKGNEVGFRCVEHKPNKDDPTIKKILEDMK